MGKEEKGISAMIDIKFHGARHAWKCPICEEIVKEVGDLSNPATTIMGEKMCNDCKTKIRKLIGK